MPPAPSVITIGTFDGVHRGHAALLARARRAADGAGARVVALAFDPHPLTRLRPAAAPARLTTFTQRERLLREAGADEVVRLEPTAELLGLAPDAFLEGLVRDYRPLAIVEGPDFRFGKGRAGDLDLLRDFGRRAGFSVDEVAPVVVALSDHTVVPASSTVARWLLSRGRAGDAARVLGRPYEVEGVVVRGDRRGRQIGFPTANIRTECLAPGDGVYAAEAELEDGRTFAAAASVGTKPTFGGSERVVEAFLMDRGKGAEGPAGRAHAGDWPFPGREYGWGIRLRFLAWVREQARFESLAALVEQMHGDCLRIRAMIREGGEPSPPLEAAACP